MRGSKCQSTDMVPLRGKKLFGLHPQNKILLPFRDYFQNFQQSHPSLLYGRPLPPWIKDQQVTCLFIPEDLFMNSLLTIQFIINLQVQETRDLHVHV